MAAINYFFAFMILYLWRILSYLKIEREMLQICFTIEKYFLDILTTNTVSKFLK